MSTPEPQIEGEEELPVSARAAPAQLFLAESIRRTWWHQPSITVEYEALLVPAYWSRLIPKLNAGGPDSPPDRIECMPSDRRYFRELMVLEIGQEGVIVMHVAGGMLPHYASLPSVPGPIGTNLDDFEFVKSDEFVGKWCVRRKSDGQIMTRGQPFSRAQCEQWLSSYLKTVGTT